MKIEQTLKNLQVDEKYLPVLSVGWEDSQAHRPQETPEFLQPENFCKWRESCSLPADTDDALQAAAAMIRADAELLAMAWHVYYQLVVLGDGSPVKTFHGWPFFTQRMGQFAGVFYLLIALAVAPRAVQKYSEMNVPPEIVRDTLRELNCFCENHRKGYGGMPGIIPQQLAWLRHYLNGRLFRLGRMEYKHTRFSEFPFLGMILRERATGRKVALARSGEKFDSRGFILSNDDSGPHWTAVYEEKNGHIEANPVSPWGYALKTTARFPLWEWEKLFSPEDCFIDMHIPSGGNMTLEACRESMARAFEFFGRFFPGAQKDIIMCCSWIFNTDLEEKLPDSNLARFMRELYLFPAPSWGAPGFFFVFCREPHEFGSLAEAPRNTRLERFMLETLENGRKLRNGGMFFCREDMPRFGTQQYRAAWAGAAKNV